VTAPEKIAMRIAIRRERRRRSGSDHPGLKNSHSWPPFFDRLERLTHSLALTHKTESPLFILVSTDLFLRQGFRHAPYPLSNGWAATTLDQALDLLPKAPNVQLLVDINHTDVSVIETLDKLRRTGFDHPQHNLYLLLPAQDKVLLRFIKAIGPVRVINRQSPFRTIRKKLLNPSPLPFSRQSHFSRDEWLILTAMAQGRSLKSIASDHHKNYHRVTYRLTCIIARLKLKHRSALLHLLQKLSG
jgi:Response regulator containing a CheY-like receiver domain and an HTH DNA-binding domain